MTCSMPAICPIVAPKLGFHWSTIFASAQVAKPSLSQMSFHHFIVTRSPNHWCANSCAMTSACERRADVVACRGSSRSSTSRNVTRPGVLHRARREVGHGHEVELRVRVAHVEVLAELVDEGGGDVEREAGEARAPLGRDDADRKRLLAPLGDVEVADREGHQVARERG